MKKDMTKARFCKERTLKKEIPKTLLDYDMQRADALGYGCHYGDYKADNPNTRAEYERLTEAQGGELATCPWCGQQFKKAVGRGPKKFCSEACGDRYRAAERYKKNRKPGETVACAICGKDFTKTANHHIYCSRECYAEGQRVLGKRWREQHKKEATTNGSI